MIAFFQFDDQFDVVEKIVQNQNVIFDVLIKNIFDQLNNHANKIRKLIFFEYEYVQILINFQICNVNFLENVKKIQQIIFICYIIIFVIFFTCFHVQFHDVYITNFTHIQRFVNNKSIKRNSIFQINEAEIAVKKIEFSILFRIFVVDIIV